MFNWGCLHHVGLWVWDTSQTHSMRMLRFKSSVLIADCNERCLCIFMCLLDILLGLAVLTWGIPRTERNEWRKPKIHLVGQEIHCIGNYQHQQTALCPGLKTKIAMPLRGSCFCSFGILYFFLNSFIFPTASYTLNNCRVTQNTQAICQKNSFKVFPKDIPARVTSIELSGNNISTLNKTDLNNVPNLLRLDLTRNRISKIESSTFVVQISLKVLILNNNRLCKLQEGMFDGLVNLIELRLTSNHIQIGRASCRERVLRLV